MLKETELLDRRTSFKELPTSESSLLWLMRTWVVGHCRQQDVSDRLRAVLDDLGAAASFEYLEGFMWALCKGASRPIEVLCLCREDVSADERLLLDQFALLQQGELDDAHALLCTFLPDRAATIAVRSAETMVDGLAAVGVLLPWRSADSGRQHAATLQHTLH